MSHPGNLIFAQSGGPTAVINSSAAGVFTEALAHPEAFGKVYGAHHGIVGILEEDFFDIGQEDPDELVLLKQTPSSILGSCRYKLANIEDDETDYHKVLEVFKKYNIHTFLYNGGNDSMDTCNKISKFLKSQNFDCRVIGVPKTIDNDLSITDHCPGYGSAARYIATTVMEIYKDATVYNIPQITIIEIMGRNAGWLTAASSLAAVMGYGPDLLYLPEHVFDLNEFIDDVKRVYERKRQVVICVSEGVRTREGKLIPEMRGAVRTDAFGHKQLGGTAEVLGGIVGEHISTKIRNIELSLMQRCAAHLASERDVEESFAAGQAAVRTAMAGESDVMIGFARPQSGSYQCEMVKIPLCEVANTEKKVPETWISHDGNNMEQAYFDYAMPLIQGSPNLILENSLPRFAKLKFVQAGRV